MKCFDCGKGVMKRRSALVPGVIKGQEYSVETPALVCDKCGYLAMEGEDVPEHLRRLADAYRSAHGLLTSDQIRSCRKMLKMSQRDFARYLGVGEASIKRWELGAIQDEVFDHYLRLKTDPVEASRNAKAVARLTQQASTAGKSVAINR
jgi:putative zinc finger/helix-turn-helix YgiT family protein